MKLIFKFLIFFLVSNYGITQFPKVNFNSNENFKIISTFKNHPAIKFHHNTAFFARDHLFIPIAKGIFDGGFHIFNINDPRNPRYVTTYRNPEIREGHSVGLHQRDGRFYAAVQSSNGIKILDITDINRITEISNLIINEASVQADDYINGIWWLHWQGNYLYLSGTNLGLYIVNSENLDNPFVENRINNNQTGNFRLGSVFALGDNLVITGNEVKGMSILDIKDPVNPKLKYSSNQYAPYGSMVYGDLLLLANIDPFNGLVVFDISNPSNPQELDRHSTQGRGGYITVQDNVVHMGSSDFYYKLDISNPRDIKELGKISRQNAFSTNGLTDLDFVSVIGNMVVLSDDDAGLSNGVGFGSSLAVHQTSIDNVKPKIIKTSPNNNQLNTELKPTYGINFSKPLSIESLNSNNIKLIEANTNIEFPINITYQTNIVGISSRSNLNPGSEYKLLFKKNGVSDLSGNKISNNYSIDFKTKGTSISLPKCNISGPEQTTINKATTFILQDCNSLNPVFTWNSGIGGSLPNNNLSQVNFIYPNPGNYLVSVQIQFSNGRIVEKSKNIIVNQASTSDGPIRSSTIGFDKQEKKLWVVNSDNDSVTVIDSQNLSRLKIIPTGKNPTSISIGKDYVWVTNLKDDSIVKINKKSLNIEATIDTGWGRAPISIVASKKTDKAWAVLSGSNEIIIINDRRITNRKYLDTNLRGLATNGEENFLLITQFISSKNYGQVYKLNSNNLRTDNIITLKYDTSVDSESSGRGVPNYLFSVSIHPNELTAIIPSKKDNVDRGLQKDGLKLDFQNTVRAIVSQIDLSTNREISSNRADLNNKNLPIDAEYSENGQYIFVATAGSDSVEILNGNTIEEVTSILSIGSSPQGLVIDNSQNLLFVDLALGREVVVYDISKIGTTNTVKKVAKLRKIRKDKMNSDILHGKIIFTSSNDLRMNKDNYMSCASCHFNGTHDGRNWDFTQSGEGIRNTTHLDGKAGMGHGLLHWSGNFDEVQDFEKNIRATLAGEGFIESAKLFEQNTIDNFGPKKTGLSRSLDALEKFVSSLKTPPRSASRNTNNSLNESAKRGEQIFTNLNCTNCHFGNNYIDSDSHYVGTIKPSSGQRMSEVLLGIDTPTLQNLNSTPPYFHDGSARNLIEVINTLNHGNGQNLNFAEKIDLQEFLKSIE